MSNNSLHREFDDIDDRQLARLLIKDEIDEAFRGIDRQHSQVKFFSNLYFILIIGSFSLAGFLAGKPSDHRWSTVGIAVGISLFAVGWAILSFVTHKISMLNFIYRHLSIFRELRLSLLEKYDIKEYMFPTSPDDETMPRVLYIVPYVFFVLNFLLLCGSIFYYSSFHFSVKASLLITYSLALIAGSFYPRACVYFNLHMRISIRSHDITLKRKAMTKLLRIRRKQKFSRHIIFWFSFVCTIIVILLTVSTLINSALIRNQISSSIATVIVITFAIIRYQLERYRIKVSLKRLRQE